MGFYETLALAAAYLRLFRYYYVLAQGLPVLGAD